MRPLVAQRQQPGCLRHHDAPALSWACTHCAEPPLRTPCACSQAQLYIYCDCNKAYPTLPKGLLAWCFSCYKDSLEKEPIFLQCGRRLRPAVRGARLLPRQRGLHHGACHAQCSSLLIAAHRSYCGGDLPRLHDQVARKVSYLGGLLSLDMTSRYILSRDMFSFDRQAEALRAGTPCLFSMSSMRRLT